MASFENQGTNMKFSLTIDDAKKTVSVSNITPAANATLFDTVAATFKPLFVVTPTAVKKTSTELLVE